MNKFALIFFCLIVHCTLKIENCMSQSGWYQVNSGVTSNLNCIVFPPTATGNFGFVAGENGVLMKTTNGGTNWFSVSPDPNVNFKTIFFLDYSNGWTSGWGSDSVFVYRTTNAGTNWTKQFTGYDPYNTPKCSFFRNSNKGYIGGGKINFSPTSQQSGFDMNTTNGGLNWTKVNGPDNIFAVYFCSLDTGWRSTYWVGGAFKIGDLQWTTNGGINWDETQVWNLTYFYDIYFCSAIQGWATGYCFESSPLTVVYRTKNCGYDWDYSLFLSPAIMYSLFFINDHRGWMCGQEGTIKVSNDTGKTWTNQNSGVTADLKSIKFTDINTGYAAGNNGVILKTTTGGSVGINNQNENITNFRLEQNYPNPFNPTTKIKFSISPLSREVGEARGVSTTLRVYNILGKEITTLVNKSLPAGEYEVTFDARNLPGEIYFYQLRAGDFMETKKMLFLK
jgi:photosystem II stability/assembly factor-like uncharacterized protein